MIPELQEILDTYKTQNNESLKLISTQLYNDFNANFFDLPLKMSVQGLGPSFSTE